MATTATTKPRPVKPEEVEDPADRLGDALEKWGRPAIAQIRAEQERARLEQGEAAAEVAA